MKGVFNWSVDLDKSGDFDPGTDSKTFDDLVAKADVEPDQDTRNDLYQAGRRTGPEERRVHSAR